MRRRGFLQSMFATTLDPVYRALHPTPPRPRYLDDDPYWFNRPGEWGHSHLPTPHDPGPVYSPNQDHLRVSLTASKVATIVVTGTQRLRNGGSQAIGPNGQGFTLTTTADRLTHTFDLTLGSGGEVDTLAIVSTTSGVVSGECYAVVQTARNLPPGVIVPVAVRIAGYVTAGQPRGYPGSPIVSSVEGEPAIKIVTVAAPAPNAEFTYTCPAGARQEILALVTQLNTDATPGNRQTGMQWRAPGPTVLGVMLDGTFVPPSTAEGITWYPNYPEITNSAFAQAIAALPQRLILRAGDSIVSETIFFGPADTYLGAQLTFREWLEVSS